MEKLIDEDENVVPNKEEKVIRESDDVVATKKTTFREESHHIWYRRAGRRCFRVDRDYGLKLEVIGRR